MPVNEPTLNDLLFDDDLFKDSLEDTIVDLALNRIDIEPKFANILRQVLSAQKDETSRLNRGEAHTVETFTRVQTFSILGVLLLSQHIDTLPRRRRDRSATQRRVLDLLLSADDVFTQASNDVQQNHPDIWAGTELPLKRLGEKLWFTLYEVTAIECEQLANKFTAMLHTAIIPGTSI